jgi:hypothetical protein
MLKGGLILVCQIPGLQSIPCLLSLYLSVFCVFFGYPVVKTLGPRNTQKTQNKHGRNCNRTTIRSFHADDLLEPPAESDKQKAIVLEKLRRLAFKIVADKLEDPADDK